MSRIAQRIGELLGDNADLSDVLKNASSKLYSYGFDVNSIVRQELNAVKGHAPFNAKSKGLSYMTNDKQYKYWVNEELPKPLQDRIETHELAHIGFTHPQIPGSVFQKELEAKGVVYGIGHRLGQPLDANLDMISAFLAQQANDKNKAGYYGGTNRQIVDDVMNMFEYQGDSIKSMVDRFTRGVV
jgi:hypothetical protein